MNTKDKVCARHRQCQQHGISVASYEAGCWMCATDELLDNYNYRCRKATRAEKQHSDLLGWPFDEAFVEALRVWACKSCDKPIIAKWTNFLERSPPTCCDETYHLKMLEEADF